MKNNFFLKSPKLVQTSEFPEYIRLLQYNNDSTSETTLGARILNNYEYDNVGNAAADFLFDYKYGTNSNVGSGNLLKYYNLLYRINNDSTTLKSRESFFNDFVIIECDDYSHQALSAFYRDFVPMVFCNGRKIWQKYVGTIRHSSSKKAFLLINPNNNVFNLEESDITTTLNDYIEASKDPETEDPTYTFQVRICPKMATTIDDSWAKIKLDLSPSDSSTSSFSSETNYITFKLEDETLTFLQKDNIDDYDVYYTYTNSSNTTTTTASDDNKTYYRLPNSKYFFTVKQEYDGQSISSDENCVEDEFTLIERQSPDNTTDIASSNDRGDYYESHVLKVINNSSNSTDNIKKAKVTIYLNFRISDTFASSNSLKNYTFYLSSKQIEVDAVYYTKSVSFGELAGRSLTKQYSPVDSISYFDFYDSNGYKVTTLGSTSGNSLSMIRYSSDTNSLLFSRKVSALSTAETTETFEIIPNYTSTRKLEYNIDITSTAETDVTISFNRIRFLKYVFPYNLTHEEYLIYKDGKLESANEIDLNSTNSKEATSITVEKGYTYTLVLYDNGDIDSSESFTNASKAATNESDLTITNSFQGDSNTEDLRKSFKRYFWKTASDTTTPISEVAVDPYLNTEENDLYENDLIYTEVFPYELNEREDGSLLHLKTYDKDLIIEPTFKNIKNISDSVEGTNTNITYSYNSIKFNGEFENSDISVEDPILEFMKLNIFESTIENPILSGDYSYSYICNVDEQYEILEKNMMAIISDSNVEFDCLLDNATKPCSLALSVDDEGNYSGELKDCADGALLICYLSSTNSTDKTTVFYAYQSENEIEPSQLESRIIPSTQDYFILFFNREALETGGTLSFYCGADSPRYVNKICEFKVTESSEGE